MIDSEKIPILYHEDFVVDFNRYPLHGRPIASNDLFDPLGFYDNDLYEMAFEECGFAGAIWPTIEEPFAVRWSKDAWNKILGKGFEIIKRSPDGLPPWRKAE